MLICSATYIANAWMLIQYIWCFVLMFYGQNEWRTWLQLCCFSCEEAWYLLQV